MRRGAARRRIVTRRMMRLTNRKVSCSPRMLLSWDSFIVCVISAKGLHSLGVRVDESIAGLGR